MPRLIPKGLVPLALCLLFCLPLPLYAASTVAIAVPSLETADPVLLKAEISLSRGDGDQAASIYTALLKKYPGAWEPLVGLATIAQRRVQYEQAERLLSQAATLHPNQPQVWAELAHLYNHWAQSEWKAKSVPNQAFKANAALERAQKLAPSNPLVLTYFGEIALDRGERALAQRALQLVLEAQPDYVPAMRQAARVYMLQKDYNRARNVLLRAMELAPQDSATYFLMAQLLQQVDRPQEALQMAQRSENFDFGELPERDLLMAQEYTRLGDSEKAIAYYQTLARYAPDNPQITLKIAQLREHRGDQALAVKVYQQATAQDPSILANLIGQAQTAMRAQPNEATLGLWRKVLAISPGNPTALHGLASIYFYQSLSGGLNLNALAEDRQYFDQTQAVFLKAHPEEIPLLAVDRVKLDMAAGNRTLPDPAETTELTAIANQPSSSLAAGEAAFLMGKYPLSQELWEGFDGQTAAGYLQAADRLTLERELYTSKLWYLRANQLQPTPLTRSALAGLDRQKKEAQDYLSQGDIQMSAGNAKEALTRYQAALDVDPQLVSGYLKLAEAQQKLRLKKDARVSLDKAVALQPSLLSSEAFAKRYKGLGGKVKSQPPTK